MPRELLKKIRRVAMLGLALSIVLPLVDYVVGMNSPARKVAERAIASSPAVQMAVGEVQTVSMQKLWGFGLRSAVGSDFHEFKFSVRGADGTLDIRVKLRGRGDKWTVVASEPLL